MNVKIETLQRANEVCVTTLRSTSIIIMADGSKNFWMPRDHIQ